SAFVHQSQPMSGLAQHLSTMAYQNAWANHRLLATCCRLSPAEFAAARVSFFPSIKATLNHILTVDWYYVDPLERWRRSLPVEQNPDRFFEPEEPFDDCARLSAAQHEVDRRLVALCASLREDELEESVAVMRSAGVLHEPVTRLLAHLFQH